MSTGGGGCKAWSGPGEGDDDGRLKVRPNPGVKKPKMTAQNKANQSVEEERCVIGEPGNPPIFKRATSW